MLKEKFYKLHHSIQIVETKVALYFQLCALFAAQEFSQSKCLSLHEQNATCHKKCNQQPHLDENVPRAHSPAARSGGDVGKECQVCGNTFKTAAHLWAHKLLHKEKRYECGCCNKKYTRRADLRVHMRSHTGEMPYSCQLCEKRFPIRGQLTYHLQRHRGMTHVCAYCGVNYDNRSTLKEHLFKHTGMPYRCELCSDVGFTRRLRFANHMQRAHNQTLSEDELAQVFAKYTGKAVRFKVIDGSGTECDGSQDSQYHESAATVATNKQ